MTDQPQKRFSTSRFAPGGRKVIDATTTALVKQACLPGHALPLVIEPAIEDVDLLSWAAAPGNREHVQGQLARYGGILFRSFAVNTVAVFEEFIRIVSGPLLEYHERSSPRSQVAGNVYTSTDYPADEHIFLHNEQSYNLIWPQKISFCCLVPAEQGGETPIADCRNVFKRIDPAIRDRFIEKQYMYVRNFGSGYGLSWQTAFQTSDRAEVEAYCHRAQIMFEWLDGNRLRTRQIRPMALPHPTTGEMTWFNHATFFHVSTLSPAVRTALQGTFAEDELPNNTFYGDGTPIEESVLDELRAIYQQETIAFPWQQGDILLLDNMLVAHGRAPFTGSRKVVVAMTEPTSNGLQF
jgi:alpha-ketoglutarate-dependent taurine dioxygenase